MKILLDAMGGDHCPDEAIKGAVSALQEIESEIILIGNEKLINEKVKEFYGKETLSEVSSRLSVINATQVIENTDKPLRAIKAKKDASMVKGFELVQNEEVDVFISSGNTGAFMAGGTLLVGRIKGIDRPAIAPMLPAYKKSFMLMDAGANTNCKPLNLVQFAQMSTIYLRNTFGIEKPKIGLLNIGTEETKGNDLVKDTYNLLKEHSEEYGINFIGNVEGRDCFSGEIDAVITDGFTGNVFLKTTEGLGKLVKRNFTESLKRNFWTILGAIPCMPAIKKFAKTMDYKEYGGALFLGVKKPVVKAHGSSDEYLFYFTLKQAENFVKSGAVEKMKEEFEKR